MCAKLKVEFSKTGDMKFVSHLDLVRLLQRASRRAGLPVVMTKGFSPRLKISITRALKLGVESRSEEAIFTMCEPMPPEEFAAILNSRLPEGVKVLNAKEIL